MTTAGTDGATVLLASPIPDLDVLGAALGAAIEPIPVLTDDAGLGWEWAGVLETWREAASAAAPSPRIAVAAWTGDLADRRPLTDIAVDEWCARAEVAIARWCAALGAAARRCCDGGAIVAVIERPPPLDCGGWGPETAVADAVEAMVRSLARAEGGRGVRVNAVTTPVRLRRLPVVDPPPALSSFPGSVDVEVSGAVRMLLAPDAAGVTAAVIDADCGRSWR